MKRTILRFVWVCILSALLSVTCLAHGGRTDSDGGHTDSSTGIYHYHHGQEAHFHYDMDGDGDVDCEYNFEDKTGWNSGSGTSGSSGGRSAKNLSYSDGYIKGYEDGRSDGFESGENQGYRYGYIDGKKEGNVERYEEGYAEGYEIGRKEGYETGQAEKEQELAAKFENDLKWYAGMAFFLFLLCSAVIAFVLVSRYRRKVDENNKRLITERDRLRSEYNRKISQITNIQSTKENLADDIDLRVTVTPIKGKTSSKYPYGDYTVFVTNGGKRYHRKYGCSNATFPVHILNLPEGITPCRSCAGEDLNGGVIPEWFRALEGKEVDNISAEPQNKLITSYENERRPAKKQYSGFIDEYWYQGNALFIKMKNSGTYCYRNVPESLFEEMMKSESIGAFFHAKISGVFPYENVK